MHPSVIHGGNNNNATAQQQSSQQQQQQQPQHPAQSSSGPSDINSGHHQQSQPTNTRPSGVFSSPFASTGRFPFDDSDDDMFGDLDMRARMGRMGGFDWGSHPRRAGTGGTGASGAGAFGTDADAFFNSSDFGFPSAFGRRAAGASTAPSTAQTTQQQPPLIGTPPSTRHDRSHFYDHLPEEFRQYFPESFGHSFPRMRSQPSQSHAAQSPPTTAGGFMRQQQPQPQYAQSPPTTGGFVRPTHPQEPQQHFVPQTPPQQQQQQQYPHYQQQQPTSVPVSPATDAPRPKLCDAAIQTDLLPATATSSSGNDLRNTTDVGHATEQFSAPATNNSSGGPAPTAERMVPIRVEHQASAGAPPPPPQRSAQPQQQQQQQPRPAPFVVTKGDQVDSGSSSGDVPQTPHTADCINKIQSIQTNVLDLMSAVDQFNGCRGDKEYMYIDEMLTRNLLKLDTIDTQGRESIRLARKEAIRCIQASITVLEAKAEQNTNRKKAEQQLSAETTTATADDGTTVQTDAKQATDKVEEPAEIPATAGEDEPVTKPDDASGDNVEHSLEAKLADFQRKSEERESPETHVSAVQIQLKPVAPRAE